MMTTLIAQLEREPKVMSMVVGVLRSNRLRKTWNAIRKIIIEYICMLTITAED